MDVYNLNRFIEAQDKIFDTVLKDLLAGRKESDWMWYVFPQLKGLGVSGRSEYYGIDSIEEARAYLAHPILGKRLETCFEILLRAQTSNPVRIFVPVDHQKLHSSTTLFSLANSQNPIFKKVIEKFWGATDYETDNLLKNR